MARNIHTADFGTRIELINKLSTDVEWMTNSDLDKLSDELMHLLITINNKRKEDYNIHQSATTPAVATASASAAHNAPTTNTSGVAAVQHEITETTPPALPQPWLGEFRIVVQTGDGACLFRSLVAGTTEKHEDLRKAICNHMTLTLEHNVVYADDQEKGRLEDNIIGEINELNAVQTDTDLHIHTTKDYIDRMRFNDTFGGTIEIRTLTNMRNVCVMLCQTHPTEGNIYHKFGEYEDGQTILTIFHEGIHYNSLEKVD